MLSNPEYVKTAWSACSIRSSNCSSAIRIIYDFAAVAAEHSGETIDSCHFARCYAPNKDQTMDVLQLYVFGWETGQAECCLFYPSTIASSGEDLRRFVFL